MHFCRYSLLLLDPRGNPRSSCSARTHVVAVTAAVAGSSSKDASWADGWSGVSRCSRISLARSPGRSSSGYCCCCCCCCAGATHESPETRYWLGPMYFAIRIALPEHAYVASKDPFQLSVRRPYWMLGKLTAAESA